MIAMSKTELKEEIKREVESLSDQQLEKVLRFARRVKAPLVGTPGHTLSRFVGSIPPDDLKEMMDAIEKDCGKIDQEGWD
jgi:hypothetical protein